MKYHEIFKLKEMLDNQNIPYSFTKFLDGYAITIPGIEDFDVVEHRGSYGNRKDLLEIMGLLTKEEKKHDTVKGHLTAEDVFKRIKKAYKKLN